MRIQVLASFLCSVSFACGAPRAVSQPQAPTPAAQAPAAQESQDSPGKLTLDKVFELFTKLRLPSGLHAGWMPDGEHYLAVGTLKDGEKKSLLTVDVQSGEKRPLFDAARMEEAFAALPGIPVETAREWSRRTSFDFTKPHDALLLNEAGDLFYWKLGAERAVRLTSDPAEEVGESFSPDGRMVAFVRDSNLYVVGVDGTAPLALTTGGDEDHLYGRLDWVYQEEVYGRGNFQASWWSPDSRRIAFLVLDETDVPKYTIADTREVHPKLEVWRYPKAGDPNPKAKLGVVDVAGGPVKFLDLDAYPADRLIVRVGWSPDGKEVIFQVQDRIQTWLDLARGNPQTGKVERILRDGTPTWIEPVDGLFWIGEGPRFLWLSEREGFKRLFLYPGDGREPQRLTDGPWEVDEVHAVDEETQTIWFSADKADVKGSQLYRMPLTGGEITAVTKGGGTHGISLAPKCQYFVDTTSSAGDPGRADLCRRDGAVIRTLAKGDTELVQKSGLVPPEFVQVKTHDGFVMEAMLIKPPGFDPSKKYPVLCHTYSGPHAPQVRDAFGGFNALFHQMLAQEGYLIWICDNRSASGKGHDSAQGVYRNFGQQELADLEEGLDWLVAQGFADPSRIGMWGWSYGGYMTSYALTHSKRFKMGIAGAPVTDWRLYDSIYTERYMDTPQANPEGYDRSSVVKAAANLSGALLVVCGEIDENVHAQNTLQLSKALQDAGKPFELMVYPGNRHGITAPPQRKHLYGMMAEFVRRNL
jgi:dipeptidyl-peptidase 4